MSDHHHHHHDIAGKNLGWSILINIGITAAQLIGGFISGSLALISDAVHNFTDVISLIISYVANWLKEHKKQTLKQTFGFKRAEILAAFINAVSLIVIAVFLAIEAIKRFTNPQEIKADIVILLAILGIIGNGLSVMLIKKDAKNNLNIQSAYIHLFTDMLTSVAVLIGGLLMKYFGIFKIDAILTLLISVYLFYISWRILLDSVKILMLFTPDHILVRDIEKEILKIEAVRNIHHVHVWQLNDKDTHFEAHVEFKTDIKLSHFDVICEEIEQILAKKFHIYHSNLQPEYKREDPKDFIIQD